LEEITSHIGLSICNDQGYNPIATFHKIATLQASWAGWRTQKDRPERRLPWFGRHLVPSAGLSETRVSAQCMTAVHLFRTVLLVGIG